MEYLDHALEQDFHTTLHKASTWSRKKGKHLKDKKVVSDKKRDPWASQRDNYGKMKFTGVGFRYVHRGQFKHTRAKRVYLEEESYDYDPSFWFDEEDYLRDMEDQNYNDNLFFEDWRTYLGAGDYTPHNIVITIPEDWNLKEGRYFSASDSWRYYNETSI